MIQYSFNADFLNFIFPQMQFCKTFLDEASLDFATGKCTYKIKKIIPVPDEREEIVLSKKENPFCQMMVIVCL